MFVVFVIVLVATGAVGAVGAAAAVDIAVVVALCSKKKACPISKTESKHNRIQNFYEIDVKLISHCRK